MGNSRDATKNMCTVTETRARGRPKLDRNCHIRCTKLHFYIAHEKQEIL
jgi:hypothetical protein